MASGRWLWCGGTDWLKKPENVYGAYNCSSTNVTDWEALALMMNLAMQGCGTGAVLEDKYIKNLPVIRNYLTVEIVNLPGSLKPENRHEETIVSGGQSQVNIFVGDSRKGWVDSYSALLQLSTSSLWNKNVKVFVCLGAVRNSGEKLKGFGGTANPVALAGMYEKLARILNNAIGRQLTALELCKLIDEAAVVVVAGNVRRSAGMRQASPEDIEFATAKDELWQQDSNGQWKIDPNRDCLRMANHTLVYHRRPTLEEVRKSIQKQFYSGEGAIQWAGEAVARANVDLLNTKDLKNKFLDLYDKSLNEALNYLIKLGNLNFAEAEERMSRYATNPCVTADTWVHTENGAKLVKDLIGKQTSVCVNGELFSTTPEGFWSTGVKSIFKVVTEQGFELRLTENHKLLKLTAQTKNKQYSEWTETKDLTVGDRIFVHNHRGVEPWDGSGNFDEGWLLGSLVGDGSITSNQWGESALLRYWGEEKEIMCGHAIGLLKKTVKHSGGKEFGHHHKQLDHQVVNSGGLAKLAESYDIKKCNKAPTAKVEESSYEFYRGFLRGFFDADGSVQGSQEKGVSVRLAQSNLNALKAVQRMLARLGIISTIYQNRREEGFRELPDSNRYPSLYFCKTQHELVIANDNIQIFRDTVGFQEEKKSQKLQELTGEYKRKPNRERFIVRIKEILQDGIEEVFDCTVPGASQFDANGVVAHNCGEILFNNNFCNLSEVHLNTLDGKDLNGLKDAFKSAGLIAAILLNDKFPDARYQKSREIDPIVGVSFTGLFDFFVNLFGESWLRWWEGGREEYSDRDFIQLKDLENWIEIFPDEVVDIINDWNENQGRFAIKHSGICDGLLFKEIEQFYLTLFKDESHKAVWEYCDAHSLKRPNRCTTVQPSGTKSLLTGASPGWHPPKAARFIRRITFGRDDAVALACMDYGYSIIPSQSCKDSEGNLLNDPFHPLTTEWLVEIPTKTVWADNIANEVDISKFSVKAQFDFYLQVQNYYATHNTSATLEIRQEEIEEYSQLLYQNIQECGGYSSAALLARFDGGETFPRLPFEPISKEKYEELWSGVLSRRTEGKSFDELLQARLAEVEVEDSQVGPTGCDSDKCLFKEAGK